MLPLVGQNYGMPKRSVRHPEVVAVFAKNCRALMNHYGENPTSAAKRCKVPQQQFDRFVKGQHSVQLENVGRVAKGYDLEPYQLLIPGLDPADPQVLRVLSADEEKLYHAVRDLLNSRK